MPFGRAKDVTATDVVVAPRRVLTAETALRLARYFGTSAEFWVNLQKTYEPRLAEVEVGPKIRRQVKPAA